MQEIQKNLSMDERANENANSIDLSKYSPFVKEKKLMPLNDENITPSKYSLIVFDLETSGFDLDTEILQISAVSLSGDEVFNAYINPINNIDPRASEVNNLTVSDGQLFYRGELVQSMKTEDALNKFLYWLKETPLPRILIGHNINRFDCPHLFHHVFKHNLVDQFCISVAGFIDTLPLFREKYPDFRYHKQAYLVERLLNETYETHNAIEDVKSLKKLIISQNISDLEYLKHSSTFISMRERREWELAKKDRYSSFHAMIEEKALPKGLAEKFAGNGITFEDLKVAYRTGGMNELTNYLGQKPFDEVVGTTQTIAIQRIFGFFERRSNLNI